MRIVGHIITWPIVICGLLILIAGPFLLFINAVWWLRTGVYQSDNLESILLSLGSPWPQTHWLGLQQIFDSVMQALLRLPVWSALMIVGFAITLVGFQLAELFDLNKPATKK